MSATIDLALFAAFFDGAPTLTVPGRLFPVAVHYAPPEAPRGERRAWRDDGAGGEGGEGGEGAPGEAAVVGGEAGEAAGVLAHGRRMLPSRARELLSPKAYLSLLQRIDAKYAARSNPNPHPNPNPIPNAHPSPSPHPSPNPHPDPNPEQAPSARARRRAHLRIWRRGDRAADLSPATLRGEHGQVLYLLHLGATTLTYYSPWLYSPQSYSPQSHSPYQVGGAAAARIATCA